MQLCSIREHLFQFSFRGCLDDGEVAGDRRDGTGGRERARGVPTRSGDILLSMREEMGYGGDCKSSL